MECIIKKEIENINYVFITVTGMRFVTEMHIFFLAYDISISVINQCVFPLS